MCVEGFHASVVAACAADLITAHRSQMLRNSPAFTNFDITTGFAL
jgi:hypothetical protein